jgi:biopolymer transport protein ExbB
MPDFLKVCKESWYVMGPLAVCSVLALAIIIEKLVNLRKRKIIQPDEINTIGDLMERGLFDKVYDLCLARPGVFNNLLKAALECKDLAREDIKEAVLDAGRQEVPKLERYLGVLGTIASISPLLGLLGTVTGMIKVFRAISVYGVGTGTNLSMGISEALITTVIGLSIAIPSLFMYNYFSDRAELIVLELEKQSMRFLNLICRSRRDIRKEVSNR